MVDFYTRASIDLEMFDQHMVIFQSITEDPFKYKVVDLNTVQYSRSITKAWFTAVTTGAEYWVDLDRIKYDRHL